MDLSPVKLTPAIKDYIWGGRKLIDDFNKKTTLDRAAESWELSTHPDGQSIIKGGDFDGKTLTEYISENGSDILGENAEKFDFFPILILCCLLYALKILLWLQYGLNHSINKRHPYSR